jgi:ribosomal protein S18 acetylase RimI-like enzyme
VPATIRKATLEDVSFLTRVVDMASEGLIPALWDAMAPEGMDGAAVGQALVSAEDGDFSYRYGFLLEEDGEPIGGMIGYPLPTTAEPAGPEVPEAFVAIVDLTNLVPGYWYINMVALLPQARGKGLGAALLNEAEAQAHSQNCPGLALIVAATNDDAIRSYTRSGYREMARRPFEIGEFGLDPTDALLMLKETT